jgi:hypothetical protein
MIREFNEQWEKDYVRKTAETLEDQTVGEKEQPSRMLRGRTLTRQWEKVQVMKRKTGNLRTGMRMVTGLEVRS